MAYSLDNLLQACMTEWEFFGQSTTKLDGTSRVGRKEYEDGAYQRVGDYWRFIGGPYQNLTGRDRGTPWSAAFVSWCMNQGGAGDRFPYSASHADYLNEAIRNTAVATASIAGHRLAGYRVKVGDLIAFWRGEVPITFDTARQVGWYQSHSDIVVEVGAGVAYSIGGNVMNSVTRREVRLTAAGELADVSQNWFVIVENRL